MPSIGEDDSNACFIRVRFGSYFRLRSRGVLAQARRSSACSRSLHVSKLVPEAERALTKLFSFFLVAVTH